MEPSKTTRMINNQYQYCKDSSYVTGMAFMAGTSAGAVYHSVAGFRHSGPSLSNKLKGTLLRVGRRAPVWGGLLSAYFLLDELFHLPLFIITKSEDPSIPIMATTLAVFNYRSGALKMLGYGFLGSTIASALVSIVDNSKEDKQELDKETI